MHKIIVYIFLIFLSACSGKLHNYNVEPSTVKKTTVVNSSSSQVFHDFISAELKYKQNDLANAYKDYKAVGEASGGKIVAVQKRLLEYQLRKKDFNSAKDIITDLLENDSEPELYIQKAILELALKERLKVINTFNSGIQTHPENSLLKLSKELYKLSNSAEINCTDLNNLDITTNSSWYYYQALCADYFGQSDTAQKFLVQSLEIEPDDLIAREFLVRILLLDNNKSAALSVIKGAEKQSIKLNYLNSLIQQGDKEYEKFIEQYLPREEFKEVFIGSIIIGGYRFVNQQNFNQAINRFLTVKAVEPDNYDLNFVIAALYARNELFDSALEQYEQVPADSKRSLEAILSSAVILNQKGNVKAAIKKIEQGIETEPENERLWQAKMLTYANNGMYQEQVDVLIEMMTIFPDIENLKLEYSGALLELGKVDEAIQILEDLLNKYPTNPDIQNSLAYTYAQANQNLTESLHLVNQAIKSVPDSPYYLDTRAWIYYLLNDYPRAKVDQARALKLLPGDPVLLGHYGDILVESGEAELAKTYYKEALAQIDRLDNLNHELKTLKKDLKDKLE